MATGHFRDRAGFASSGRTKAVQLGLKEFRLKGKSGTWP